MKGDKHEIASEKVVVYHSKYREIHLMEVFFDSIAVTIVNVRHPSDKTVELY